MDFGWVSPMVSVAMSIGVVLITYGKTWASLNSTMQNLSKVVERLSALVDNMSMEQMQIAKDSSCMKTEMREIEKRICRIESRIDSIHGIS